MVEKLLQPGLLRLSAVLVTVLVGSGCSRTAAIATGPNRTTTQSATGTGTRNDTDTATVITATSSATPTSTGTDADTSSDCPPYPSCFAVVVGCLGQGACRQQSTDMCGQAPCPASSAAQPTRRIKNTCWDNDVTVQEVADFSTPNAPFVGIAARKNGAACYTMTGSDALSFSGTYTYFLDDGFYGARLAVYTVNSLTGQWSISCAEGGTVDIPARCHPDSLFPNRDSECVAGTCSWD